MKRILLALAAFVAALTTVFAKVTLPAIWSSDMVLQQQSDVLLRGTTDRSRTVKVWTSWDGKTSPAKPSADGSWSVMLRTPAAGGPYEIRIDDGDVLTLGNLLVGEVWFCSGQSNMEMPVQGFDRQPVEGCLDVIARAKPSTPIRIFSMDRCPDGVNLMRQYNKHPQQDCKGMWLTHTPEGVAVASAAAYFFAAYLEEVLEVPVGIINSTWGGSRIEAWMSREAIAPFGRDLSFLDREEDIQAPWNAPTALFNAKVSPLLNFPIRGMLWYQGESNRDNAAEYERLMPAMIADYRAKWNVGEFPVYFVEIAPYAYEGNDGTSAARFREAQMKNWRDIPMSGMVSTVDIGMANSIHPVNKKTVGRRLAIYALGQTYGMKGFGYASPVYRSMEIAGGKIYINLDNAGNGPCPMWTSLKGFEIAGEDRVFHPAFAEVETSTCRLAVSSPDVPSPVAVRYAYRNVPEYSVYNIYGLPLVPFRTDDWPL